MNDQERTEALAKAQDAIDRDGWAACVCGQMFFIAASYVEHREQCQHAARAKA